ncbi:MAG: leucine-rich repeat protein [Anaerostipes sp.]|nr:leucine-rich repeat protein [Anaerostipes sp.]
MKLRRVNWVNKGIILLVMIVMLALAGHYSMTLVHASTEYDNNGFAVDGEGNPQYEPATLDTDGYYAISNAGQLYWFAEKVNSGDNTINGKLTADITVNNGDFSVDENFGPLFKGASLDDSTGVRTWTTIGKYDVEKGGVVSFKGIFDGKSHKVSGLYHNNTMSIADAFKPENNKELYDYGSMFTYNSGTVKNLTLENSYFRTPYYCGGIVGVNGGTIENCVNSSYSTALMSGGIAASGKTNSNINKCTNNGEVKGNGVSGGIMAAVQGGGKLDIIVTVSNSVNTGKVYKATTSYGGIVGDGTLTATGNHEYKIESCYNTYDIGQKDIEICGRVGSEKISNCYYVSKVQDQESITGVMGKTKEQFLSGAVTYLLNGSTSVSTAEKPLVWYQTLGDEGDDFPLLDQTHKVVYQQEKDGTNTYTNRSNIGNASISGIVNKNYTGKTQIQAQLVVKLGNKILKNGVDYTTTYKNNVNIGTATVSITGKGAYTGTVLKTFRITVTKGKFYTIGSMKYKVTNASITGKGAVTLTGTTKNKSKMTSYSVLSTVKIGRINFKVTAIGDKLFKNCKKLKKVTIGYNVKTIGKETFYNCKKLGSIKIKSKQLTKVNKNAIKNIYKKAKIKVPSSKYKKYKKLFSKRTGFKKSMKIKK